MNESVPNTGTEENDGESACIFDCAGTQLLGILHEVENAQTGVVFVAGGGQYRAGSHRLYVQIARRLAGNRIAVFRFDHRGVGDSDGTFGGFETLDNDIHAAIETFQTKQPAIERVVVLGLCDGAAAALLTAFPGVKIAGLVLINPWVHSSGLEARTRFARYYTRRLGSREFWSKTFRGQLDLISSIKSFGQYLADLLHAGREFDENDRSPPFVRRMLDCMKSYRGSILVILSGQDLVAQQFEQLVTHDRNWKDALDRPCIEVTKFPSADHTFSSREHRELFEDCLIAWLQKLDAGAAH